MPGARPARAPHGPCGRYSSAAASTRARRSTLVNSMRSSLSRGSKSCASCALARRTASLRPTFGPARLSAATCTSQARCRVHIQRKDAQALEKNGVAAVYTPKDFELNRIMSDVVRIVERANGQSNV